MRDTLIEIAHDPSPGARSRLLITLSDLILSDRVASAAEVILLCDVARLILAIADDLARQHFATAIAPSKNTPRDMVMLLIDDKVAIAGPLLRDSPILTKEDLRGFAERLADDYLAFIAQRQDVGQGLVEILVRRGGELVQLAIAENPSARLSPDTLKILINTAQTSEPLCRTLVRRQEVSKADAERLVHLIAGMLKARMVLQADSAHAERERMLAADLAHPDLTAVDWPQMVPAEDPTVAPRSVHRVDLAHILAAARVDSAGLDRAVKILCDEDRFNDLTALIGALANMDEVSVMHLLVRGDAEGISLVMKALGVSSDAFFAVAAFRKRRLKLSDTQSRYEREDYAKIAPAQLVTMQAQMSRTRR